MYPSRSLFFSFFTLLGSWFNNLDTPRPDTYTPPTPFTCSPFPFTKVYSIHKVYYILTDYPLDHRAVKGGPTGNGIGWQLASQTITRSIFLFGLG